MLINYTVQKHSGEGREGFLRRHKRRRHFPKILTSKKMRTFFLDRQTLFFIGKLHFQNSVAILKLSEIIFYTVYNKFKVQEERLFLLKVRVKHFDLRDFSTSFVYLLYTRGRIVVGIWEGEIECKIQFLGVPSVRQLGSCRLAGAFRRLQHASCAPRTHTCRRHGARCASW